MEQLTSAKMILWKGHCSVHERFTVAQIKRIREQHPGVRVIAHPECPPDVLAEADFVGSTAGMISWVEKNRPPRVVMVTECSMSDNVAAEVRDVEFIRPCNLCPHMKRITLQGIADSLRHMRHEVKVPAAVAERARLAVTRMLAVKS